MKSPEQIKKVYSFGLMINSTSLEHWQKIAVENLINSGHTLKITILNNNNDNRNTGLLQKINAYPYSKLLYRLYNRYLLKPGSKKRVQVDSIIGKSKVIYCKTRQKKFTDYFYEEDILKIKNASVDFILRFGFNIIRGEILNTARYGIWSYHHDDEQKYRGGPPGFWEIFYNDDVNGVILQQLTSQLDAGYILNKAFFRTIKHSYSANIDQIYYESAFWPCQLVKKIETGTFKPKESKSNAKIFHEPSNIKFILFILKLFRNKIKFHYNELCRVENWNTGIALTSKEEILKGELPEQWVFQDKSSKKKFNADPFIFEDNGNLYLLCENYNYRLRKGKIDISVINQKNLKTESTTTAIEEPFHLSYPFVFKHQNQIYCIPETFEKRQVRLYVFDRKTLSFQFKKVLINDKPAIDSTLLFYNNKYWLFFTQKDHPSLKLYIYFSDKPDGEYQAHKNNPVKTNIKSARPAGAFIQHGDKIYRPAQDNSSTYGKRIIINRLEQLTERDFAESYVCSIYPPKNEKSFNKGIHTINFQNKYLVIDLKRFNFLWINLSYQFFRKLKRFFKLGS